MSDETFNGAGDAAAQPQQPAGPMFSVEKLYLKDASFEAPNAPQVFNEQGQPDLQMKLNQQVTRLAENAFEVVLGVTLTCTMNGKSVYLAEVQQAGVFGLAGFEEQMLDAMLGIQCPSMLYPYASAALASLVQGGGFPPFPLQPLNFEALYAQTLQQRMQQAQDQSPATPGLEGAEPAGNA